jgi:isoleucyl-tRNA synthetase
MSDASAPSEFPLEADPARLEPRMLAWWAERGIWARMLEKNAGAEPFVLPDGPPFGSGPLHAGYVLNTVLKDMVVKYRSLMGRRCDFIRSGDSHEPSIFQRLGVFGSWEAPDRPVSWCVHEQTVLAEAEVESAPRTSPSVYVAFRAGPELVERFSSLQGREVFFVTWTAAPWTLPGNAAIAVNADAEYVFYEAGSRVLCVAKDLLAKVLAEVKADELVMKNARLPGGDVETVAFDDLRKVLVYASGEDLEHLTYQHPFLERTGRVVLGAHVTLETGTGLVHTAPAHGLEDHEIGLKYGLESYNPVRGDGRYDETAGPALRGQRVLEAETVILGLLAESGALLNAKTDTVEQSPPSCGRCHHPVILLAAAQGFIALDKGNTLAPEKIIQRYGAEVLRLWVAASDSRSDVRLSDEILQELSQGYAKIRGTLHSVLRSLHGFNPAQDMVPAAELLPEDSGVRGRLAELVARVLQAYEACEFHLVYAAVLDFCAKDLPAVYFGSLEDRLSTAATAERSRRSAQTALFEVASALLPLLAPVLSFTAEEAWQQLPGRSAESVFLAALPRP